MVLLSEKFLVENDEQHHVMTFVYRRLILVLMDAVKKYLLYVDGRCNTETNRTQRMKYVTIDMF
jgi:hypothetical protein